MSPSNPPSFGKRRPLRPGRVATTHPAAAPIPHIPAAIEPADVEDETLIVVENSFLAAMLAGLVVGCGLVGLDSAGVGQKFRPIWELFAIDPAQVQVIMPAIILLGVIGGARAAATTLLLAHAILKRCRQSSRLAYTLGGGLTATGFAGAMDLLFGQVPAHGWVIDALAGATCGFLYHLFAGRRSRG